MSMRYLNSGDFSSGDVVVKAETITPSDSADLAYLTKELHIGGAGNLAVMWPDGTTSTLIGITAGRHPYSVKRVLDTGTTATNITASY